MTAGEQSETASASELQLLSHAAEALDEVQTRIAPLSAGRGTSTGASHGAFNAEHDRGLPAVAQHARRAGNGHQCARTIDKVAMSNDVEMVHIVNLHGKWHRY
jgi:hypothetical protein